MRSYEKYREVYKLTGMNIMAIPVGEWWRLFAKFKLLACVAVIVVWI